ncbi:hypothetical protein CC85DRAFT_195073 [Cutaneotrichosporon oleaginosum]|uniref:DNA polymerase delta subunit 3 n=1 Tax=Cutaneotrichosporon oleaginosum TaxID=879819 RepID=A0A0J1AW58_9TREE|nr:uncharacterized protein CC85DRAFT_195073 [Cutaneotrichosporon oleaginosum]KLT39514.1 hypothetical protein CC85DRAFT_195073 [Cutaneotrichosporon oleaginosum]TXT06823.1 hypothetical protein COLE_06154 [Cutaneotrichosporon oleaginosum]
MTTSAELRDKASIWLSQTLTTDQRPVTYRELARELRVHVHTAKNLLSEYISSHDAVPTFLVTGLLLAHSTLGQTQTTLSQEAPPTQSLAHLSATQKVRIVNMDEQSDDGNSEAGADEIEELEEGAVAIEEDAESQQKRLGEGVARWGVVLVGQDQLDEKRQLFESATVHVYAVAPTPIKDPAVLLSSAFGLRERSDYLQPSLGSIIGETLVHAKAAKSSAKQADPKLEPGMGEKSERKEVAKPGQTTEVAKPTVKKEVTPPRQKPSGSRSKRRVIASDSEEEEPIEASEPRKAPLQQTSSMVRADDQAAMEAMMAMDVDLDEESEVTQSAPTTVAEPDKACRDESKKRKRRRVKKSRTTKDAKGYMVTTDYWTEESCSGTETDTESSSKTAAPPKAAPRKSTEPSRTSSSTSAAGSGRPKAPSKKVSMGQSTLAGFFKKK